MTRHPLLAAFCYLAAAWISDAIAADSAPLPSLLAALGKTLCLLLAGGHLRLWWELR